MKSRFPGKLSKARKNAGYTQKNIEKILNIKQSALASYESGRSRPTYENLVRLADLYNVSCDWLLDSKIALAQEKEEMERISSAFGGSIDISTMSENEIEMLKSIIK